MDLQTRKLNVIKYLIGLNDEKVFEVLEKTILKNSNYPMNENLEPFSKEELMNRVNESNTDYFAGRIKTQSELEKESEKW